jgi:Holliday junction resolvase
VKESHFCSELVRSLRKAGGFAFKIPDSPASYGGQRMRFSAPKAFDITGVYRGTPLAIECKLYKQFKGFGLNQLRDEQIQMLNAFWEAGGQAYVALNIRLKTIKGIQKHENRLLLFEWPLRFHSKTEIMNHPYIEGSKGLFSLDTWLESLITAA